MKTNTRVIRVYGDKLGLGPKARRDGESLCDYCGAFEFCTRIKAAAECDKMIPPLLFTNPVGLEGKFSTLRLGLAWSERLKVAGTVALYNPKTEELIGFARVLKMATGTLGEIIDLTASCNHTFLGVDIEDKSTALRRVIKNHYGSNFASEDKPATAIYCERLNGKEHQRLEKTWTMDRKRSRRSAPAH
jgi:hypothetical protein